MTTLPRIGRHPDDPVVRESRSIDGARSPWFFATARAIAVHESAGVFTVELAEKRIVTFPYLRIPLFFYWRRRSVRGLDMGPLGVISRTFLSTGHVPAQWWL